jgi:hypothetical protein
VCLCHLWGKASESWSRDRGTDVHKVSREAKPFSESEQAGLMSTRFRQDTQDRSGFITRMFIAQIYIECL